MQKSSPTVRTQFTKLDDSIALKVATSAFTMSVEAAVGTFGVSINSPESCNEIHCLTDSEFGTCIAFMGLRWSLTDLELQAGIYVSIIKWR